MVLGWPAGMKDKTCRQNGGGLEPNVLFLESLLAEQGHASKVILPITDPCVTTPPTFLMVKPHLDLERAVWSGLQGIVPWALTVQGRSGQAVRASSAVLWLPT